MARSMDELVKRIATLDVRSRARRRLTELLKGMLPKRMAAAYAAMSADQAREREASEWTEAHDDCFWAEVDNAATALRHDAAAWNDEIAERRIWDNTLLDGQETND